MTRSLKLLGTIVGPGTTQLDSTNTEAWEEWICPHCSGRQMVIVAAQLDGNYKIQPLATRWLRCVACLRGAVVNDGALHPASLPLRLPLGLPAADTAVWQEARACLGINANVAAVMLCRKLLLHIAVANGLPAKNDRDRAPTYAQAVGHLEAEGLITKKMLPWVERIRDVGNDANHEVKVVSAEQALDVAAFTEQLLVLAYEMDELIADPQRADASPPLG